MNNKQLQEKLNAHQKWVVGKTQKDMLPFDYVGNMAMGLNEACEFIGGFKKAIYHGHPLTTEMISHIYEEKGDLIFYIGALGDFFGLKFGDAWMVGRGKVMLGEPLDYSNYNETDNLTIDILAAIAKLAGDIFDMVRNRESNTAHNFYGCEQRIRLDLLCMIDKVKQLCKLLNFDILEILAVNVKKLETRFANGFSTDASMKRVDVKEKMVNISGWVMQLQDGCWLTTGVGDPPRTLVIDNAKIFETEKKALKALELLLKRFQYRTYPDAKAVAVRLMIV